MPLGTRTLSAASATSTPTATTSPSTARLSKADERKRPITLIGRFFIRQHSAALLRRQPNAALRRRARNFPRAIAIFKRISNFAFRGYRRVHAGGRSCAARFFVLRFSDRFSSLSDRSMAVIYFLTLSTVGNLKDSCGVYVPVRAIPRQLNHQRFVVPVCNLEHKCLDSVADIPLSDNLIVFGHGFDKLYHGIIPGLSYLIPVTRLNMNQPISILGRMVCDFSFTQQYRSGGKPGVGRDFTKDKPSLGVQDKASVIFIHLVRNGAPFRLFFLQSRRRLLIPHIPEPSLNSLHKTDFSQYDKHHRYRQISGPFSPSASRGCNYPANRRCISKKFYIFGRPCAAT